MPEKIKLVDYSTSICCICEKIVNILGCCHICSRFWGNETSLLINSHTLMKCNSSPNTPHVEQTRWDAAPTTGLNMKFMWSETKFYDLVCKWIDQWICNVVCIHLALQITDEILLINGYVMLYVFTSLFK